MAELEKHQRACVRDMAELNASLEVSNHESVAFEKQMGAHLAAHHQKVKKEQTRLSPRNQAHEGQASLLTMYFGRAERHKNGGGSAREGALTLHKLGSSRSVVAPGGGSALLPWPQDCQPGPGALDLAPCGVCGFVVYGAAWCAFTRRAIALLENLGIAKSLVDVDDHGGVTDCVAKLGSKEQYPLRGTPVIFAAAVPDGGIAATFVRSTLDSAVTPGGKLNEFRSYVFALGIGSTPRHELVVRYSVAQRQVGPPPPPHADIRPLPRGCAASMRAYGCVWI